MLEAVKSLDTGPVWRERGHAHTHDNEQEMRCKDVCRSRWIGDVRQWGRKWMMTIDMGEWIGVMGIEMRDVASGKE